MKVFLLVVLLSLLLCGSLYANPTIPQGVYAVALLQCGSGDPYGNNMEVPSQARANVASLVKDGFTGVSVDTFTQPSTGTALMVECEAQGLGYIDTLANLNRG